MRVGLSQHFGAILLLLCASCALAPPPPGRTIDYKGKTIRISAVPGMVPYPGGWPVTAFARGDSVVRGYVILDKPTYQALSSVDGIHFEYYNGTWGRVAVDWVGLHVLSHEGQELLQGPRPLAWVSPSSAEGLQEHLRRNGLTDISCVVHFVIDAVGNVRDAYVAVSSGYEAADRSVLEAVMRQKYPPASSDKRPVPCEASMEMLFSGSSRNPVRTRFTGRSLPRGCEAGCSAGRS